MKKNTSEELHFELDFDDGSESKEAAEKVAEKNLKAAKKELEHRAKEAEKINKDTKDVPELKDGTGKKEYKEKDNAEGSKFIKAKKPKVALGKENCKKVKLLPEGVKLTLDEAPISDAPGLGKAYKRSHYQGVPGSDLQKANYVEMTPEEAVKKAKEEGTWGNLRILIDGKLVKIRDVGSGLGDNDWNFKVGYSETPFVKKTGQEVRDTSKMSARQILDVASKNGNKIYWTDEANTPKDPDLLAARKVNPESPYNWYGHEDGLETLPDYHFGDTIRGGNNNPSNYLRKSPSKYNSYVGDYLKWKKELVILKKKLKDGQISQDTFDDEYNLIINGYNFKRGQKEFNDLKDSKARARYYNSEIALQKPFKTFKELKRELKFKDRDLENAQNNIDDLKNSGSYNTKRYKDRLADYERDLENTMRQIAALKMRLRYADENDKEALEKANQDYADIMAKYADKQAEFDKLMRRSTESYEPWGDAVNIYTKIVEANLKEDFDDLVDTLYPQGLTESRLNDLLTYKSGMLLEMLDLEDENEKIIS